LAALDAAFHFTGTPNGEIAMRWYPLAVRSGYAEAREATEAFLVAIGRRKLVMPTWEALVATPDGLAFARDVFAKARAGLQPITAKWVEATLAKAKTPWGGPQPRSAESHDGDTQPAPVIPDADGVTRAFGAASHPTDRTVPRVAASATSRPQHPFRSGC